MADQNEELSEREKLEQENFLLKSKITIKGGEFQKFSDIDPEIENQFLKNIMAFEEAEVKAVYEILGVDPKNFPPSEQLSKEELKSRFEKLLKILEEHNITYDVSEKVPLEVSYNFLTQEYLYEISEEMPPGFGWHIDGCSGDCPSCFQLDYCKNKDEIWTPEELKAEIKRRKLEDERAEEV